jgi:hypothetical protein
MRASFLPPIVLTLHSACNQASMRAGTTRLSPSDADAGCRKRVRGCSPERRTGSESTRVGGPARDALSLRLGFVESG